MRSIMQTLCGALCLLSISAQLPLVEARSLTTFRYGKLTSLWAQEACAIPEAHAFIGQLKDNGFPLSTTTIAVYDTGFKLTSLRDHARLTDELRDQLDVEDEQDGRKVLIDSLVDGSDLQIFLREAYSLRKRDRDLWHGTSVVHLIASNSEVTTSTMGEIALLIEQPRKLTLENRIKEKSLISKLSLPQLFNHSMSFAKFDDQRSEAISEAFEEITDKTIVVNSIGNYHNLDDKQPIEAGVRRLVGKVINVGSSDPTGHISLFSNRDDGSIETIRAFSDNFIQTLGIDGSFSSFGGTSGASPVVTGVLADTLAILRNLTVAQTEILLKKTAIPSSYGDPVGTLNSYKLVRVAKRLVDRGWPANNNLTDGNLYDFKNEARQLADEAIATQEVDEKFAKLRQSFFLDPDNRQVRRQLGRLYRQAGYQAQALFYGDSNLASRDAFIQSLATIQKKYFADFLLAIRNINIDSAQQLLAKFDRELIDGDIHAVIDILKKLSPEQQQQVIDFFLTNNIARIKIEDNGTTIVWKRLFDRH